jgi:cytochrome c553
MNKKLWLLACSVVLFLGCSDDNKPSSVTPPNKDNATFGNYRNEISNGVTLSQGWNEEEMLDFYNTSQGSRLMPYDWFLALEQASNSDLFRGNKNMKSLGYIPQDPLSGRNPKGLPIGFTRYDIPESTEISPIPVSASRLSPSSKDNQMVNQKWLGLTCAACHTSEIEYGGKTLRINGSPAQSDFPAFMINMSKALAATTEDDVKLTRFAKKIIPQGGYNEEEKQALKTQLVIYNDWLKNYIDINYGRLTTSYGYGRLDAFGAILNQVTCSLLDIPSNCSPANAPVSYPFLWDTSQLAWVQWNGSVNNHIARNVGEVTGVFAHTILKTDKENECFYSSAKIPNLFQLERLMGQLKSPKWVAPLPAIDHDKAGKGKALFAKNCVGCHGIRDDKGQFPMTKPNAVGNQFIQIQMTGLAEIGTDPLMAKNFLDSKLDVDPGPIRPYLDEPLRDAQKFPKVPRGVVLSTVGEKIISTQLAIFKPGLDQKQVLELTGHHLRDEKPLINPPLAYKARPLNGIWATAPYMHNGSMANLYQTLLPYAESECETSFPDAKRETSFYVGSTVFDPKKVGFESNQDGNHFLFKTVDEKGVPIPGNSNKGHSGNTFTKTRGEDGQWRCFTDDERYQLIEYMKTL